MRDVAFQIEDFGMSYAEVRMGEKIVGYIRLDTKRRAPRQHVAWFLTANDGSEEVGAFKSRDEAAFALAYRAHTEAQKVAILAKLGATG